MNGIIDNRAASPCWAGLLLLILAILISPLLLFFLPLILHLGPETANAAAATHRAIVSHQAAVRRRERSPPQ